MSNVTTEQLQKQIEINSELLGERISKKNIALIAFGMFLISVLFLLSMFIFTKNTNNSEIHNINYLDYFNEYDLETYKFIKDSIQKETRCTHLIKFGEVEYYLTMCE